MKKLIFIPFISITLLVLALLLTSCNINLHQNKNTLEIYLPQNLSEMLTQKSIEKRDDTDSEKFYLIADITGSVNQSQELILTNTDEPISVVFTDIPLNSTIIVEITILNNNILLYYGKSEEVTIVDTNNTVSITLNKAQEIFTITYDANGATRGTIPPSQTVSRDGKISLYDNVNLLYKKAYYLIGWNTQPDGNGESFKFGDTLEIKENLTLYAHWINKSVGTESNGIIIEGNLFQNTTEKIILDKDTLTITMNNDSSWEGYFSGTNSANDKGVFYKDNKVELKPFILGQYEVTQELYNSIMGTSSTDNSNNPISNISWYDAVVFCNELTKITMTEEDCYYTIEDKNSSGYYITSATVSTNIDKMGYRLPTEQEWEFAARGGNTNSDV